MELFIYLLPSQKIFNNVKLRALERAFNKKAKNLHFFETAVPGGNHFSDFSYFRSKTESKISI